MIFHSNRGLCTSVILMRPIKIKHQQKAFTLIELMVVLAIVGSVGAMVAPDLWKTYQRANERQQLMDYAHQLKTMRYGLHQQQQSFHISANQLLQADTTLPQALTMTPDSWSITNHTSLYFLPTGVTSGGTINFESPTGRHWSLYLAKLDGKIEIMMTSP